MHKYISGKKDDIFAFNACVTGITAVKDDKDETIAVDVSTTHDTQRFAHVISTLPLPVLRTLSLSDAGLEPMQSNALRQLNYGPSVKIGMQFLTAWWKVAKNNDGQLLDIFGGQTYSDSPLRTIVYPSYGASIAEEGPQSTVLIASYTWTEDAERLAALTSDQKGRLEELVLRELARIHNVGIDFLRAQLIETFPWSWSQDPYTMGALSIRLEITTMTNNGDATQVLLPFLVRENSSMFTTPLPLQPTMTTFTSQARHSVLVTRG